ncbi:MAG TPA: response regulator [Pyrinomonadaceae bacterium]
MATLLLADDSMTTQKVVSLTFADEGIEVLTAADGDTAVKLYHERQPDIVLADVNIPGLNGYEICEEIRKTSDLSTTPVVLLVGSFEPFDANEAHRVGANDYLTKPFSSIRRLVATVLAFLDDQPATEEPHAPVDEQVQEISVEPQQEETLETQPDESTISNAEYEKIETAQYADQIAEEQTNAAPELQAERVIDAEPAAEAKTEAWPAAEEPNFTATNDIEDLYSESFAETVEMPHTLAERAGFSDVSSDDGLIEAQFTGPVAEEETHEPVQPIAEDQEAHEPTGPAADEQMSTEAASEAVGAEVPLEKAYDEQPPTESETAAQSTESTNGYSTWSEPPAADDQSVTFEERPHDAPTERLTPPNAPTDEYNFEFRSEEAFFEPAPEPLTRSLEAPPSGNLSTNESDAHIGSESPDVPAETFAETTAASTPWETVAAPSDGDMKFDDRNLLEIPGQPDGSDERADLHPVQGLSMETVEHIARIVASEMSEQIIREIAERVVPMVVQQTLANKRDESNN